MENTEVLKVVSRPNPVVPRNSVWTQDFHGNVKLLEINGRLVDTGVKLGKQVSKRAVQY